MGGVLEVVAGADRPGALGKGQPVALAGLAADEDLEAAVGVDVERGVVEHPHDLVVHRTPGLAGLHRDRHVRGALRLAGHPVGVVGGDGGVEVDGVGVVAQQLSVRGDDAMEPGGGRVALEQADQAPLQVVHQGPVGADDIVGGVQIPFRRHPAPVHLAQQVDQLVQRPAGRGVPRLFTHRPHLRRISAGLCAVWTQNSPQELAGGISAELCAVQTQNLHQEISGRNLGRVVCRMGTRLAPRIGWGRRTRPERPMWCESALTQPPLSPHWLRRSGRCSGPWPPAATRR